MLKFILYGLVILSVSTSVQAQQDGAKEQVNAGFSILDSTREQDGLIGSVRRVRTETAKLSVKAGNVIEGPRVLLEVTTYDPQGNRIDNMYYPISTGSLKGNQEYIYDARGAVKEMTLRDDAGRILGREAYDYEFDNFGNWTKMTSSLVIYEAGKLIYEPIEVTYRTISYYFDDSVAKIVKPSTLPIGAIVANNTGVSNTFPKTESKTRLPEAPKAETSIQLVGANSPASDNPPPGSNDLLSTERVNTAKDGKESSSNYVVNGNATPQRLQILAGEPPPPMASVRKQVSGGVLNGKALSLPKPVYPVEAIAFAVFGKVTVQVTIDENGRVIDASALGGPLKLRAAAVRAARLARFEPTMLSGRPVKVTGVLTYNFNKQ